MTISTFKSFRSLIAATTLTAFTALSFTTVIAKEPSLVERVQRMEDIEAIHALLERYFEFQESRNFDAFANLFSQDGELILRRGTSKGGPAGIKAAMSRDNGRETSRDKSANATNAPARDRGMRHILSNVHIELNGDTATAMSRWTMLVQGEDNRTTRVGGSGRYGDKLVRENGQWKFQQRILYRDLPLTDTPSGPVPAK
jgi:hypothetical protein